MTASKLKIAPILVVDDDTATLNYIKALLEPEGYSVILASSGNQANALLERQHLEKGTLEVSGVIADWKMPGMDGLKLLSEIRAAGYTIPFILMSGAVSREELVAAAKTKATALLLKPLTKEVLLQKIKEVIGPKT